MKGQTPVTVKQLLDTFSLAKAGSVSRPVDISQASPNGAFSIELKVAGTGAPSVSVTLKFSASGENYIAPTGMDVTVVSGFLKTSGTSGVDIFDITSLIPPCKEVEITVTEANVAAATVDLWFAMS